MKTAKKGKSDVQPKQKFHYEDISKFKKEGLNKTRRDVKSFSDPCIDSDGKGYEMQYFSTNDAARKEVMMTKIYIEAGINVPNAQLVDMGHGIFAVAKQMTGYRSFSFLGGQYVGASGEKTLGARARDVAEKTPVTKNIYGLYASFFGSSKSVEKLSDHNVFVRANRAGDEFELVPRHLGAAHINEKTSEKVTQYATTLEGSEKSAIETKTKQLSNVLKNRYMRIADAVLEYGSGSLKDRFKTFETLMNQFDRLSSKKQDEQVASYVNKINFISAVMYAQGYNTHGFDIANSGRDGAVVYKLKLGEFGNTFSEGKATTFVQTLADQYGITGSSNFKAIQPRESDRIEGDDAYIILTQKEIDSLFGKIMDKQKEHDHPHRYDASMAQWIGFKLYHAAAAVVWAAGAAMHGAYNLACSVGKGASKNVEEATTKQQREEGKRGGHGRGGGDH